VPLFSASLPVASDSDAEKKSATLPIQLASMPLASPMHDAFCAIAAPFWGNDGSSSAGTRSDALSRNVGPPGMRRSTPERDPRIRALAIGLA
jgi:hypothetical protein